ncbi:kinetochore protein spc25 isoform X2 [Ananas comosus]|uniref:Kinetochore protein SPC25 n=1 Tax=Ananas comosus TaxID=4615 RepID=A0A6P5EWW5_ANACO|nr:kinetochore protein spc25 isoform X2 [Ananas comosus]
MLHAEKLSELKDHLKELEADLGESLAVKTRKESKYTTTGESLSTTIARTEQLRKILTDQRAKRDGYAALLSKELVAIEALETTSGQDVVGKENIEEAILWYYKVLGFRSLGGEGVKFIFNKIDASNLDEEYSFTIRLDNDKYYLLHCDPYMEEINELVNDLNRTNDLFKFVRIMREKFQTTALNGTHPTASAFCPVSSSVTISSPPPTSVDTRSEKSVDQYLDIQAKDKCDLPKKLRSQHPALSPHGAPVRRSPRLMTKRFP